MTNILKNIIYFGIVFLISVAFSAKAETFKSLDFLEIPEGEFIEGSTRAERNYAYSLDEAAYGHSVTRDNGWYESENAARKKTTKSYFISRNLITNAQYQQFVSETGYPVPSVSRKIWASYGLIHAYSRAVPFIWKNGKPPTNRDNHPVVLVSYEDARAFAKWASKKTGRHLQLPSETQWEKAARGVDGRIFPWGNQFDPNALNSHDLGPFNTVPVGTFKSGKSPFGLLDAAGQVFEWTSEPDGKDRYMVKGGSWDDKGCGVCRPAARHSRPDHLKHILIGFRLVGIKDAD
jgi:toxoflavin biosynthesis protein ToxD